MASNISNEQSILTLKDYKKKAINLLLKNNVLLTPEFLDTYNAFQTKDEILSYTNKLLGESSVAPLVETKDQTQIPGTVKIIQSYEEHVKKRNFNDFVLHYNNRFRTLSGILKARDIDNLTSIRRIKEMKDKDLVSTIGMVYELGETKNGHITIDLEDRSGIIKGIVLKSNDKVLEIAKNLVHDEVIAVTGTAGKDVLFITDIIFPDIPLSNELKQAKEESYAVFTGDPQIGSKAFYKPQFQKFIDWMSGKNVPKQHKEIVKKIKYLIMPGDIIEGVGIFPGQEKELEKDSVIDQYNLAYDYLKQIPPHVQIIMCPGNHDAVRLAEPQPPFNKKFIGHLKDLPNLTLISSPGLVNIGKTKDFTGFNVMLYHGFSMPYYGDKVPMIRESGGLSNMSAIMQFYLQRRHFAPAHGSTQFIPDIRYDPLVIDQIPDILVTGHVHKISIDTYRGVTTMNVSAWVKPTEYQSRFGLVPDNCRAILMNLKTREFKILNFEQTE